MKQAVGLTPWVVGRLGSQVMGELAVSRAFGDKELKKCMPEILGPEEFQAMVARDARNEQ